MGTFGHLGRHDKAPQAISRSLSEHLQFVGYVNYVHEGNMKQYFTVGMLILCLAISTKASAGSTLQRTSAGRLLSRKIELHMKDATLMHVLSTLAVVHRVP